MPASDPAGWINPLDGVVEPPAPPAYSEPDRFPRMAVVEAMPPMEVTPGGVWLVYDIEFTTVRPFDNELDALRSAVANRLEVRFVEFGVELR